MKRMLAAALSAALLIAASGCALTESLDDRAMAVWEVAPQQQLDESSTTVDVLVTRLGCNSGVTGTVNEPTVSVVDTEAVITFTVSPGQPEAAECQGNDQVPYELALPQPLGELTLIDGACDTTEARGTVYCESAVRYAP